MRLNQPNSTSNFKNRSRRQAFKIYRDGCAANLTKSSAPSQKTANLNAKFNKPPPKRQS